MTERCEADMEELQRVVASSLMTLFPKVWRLVRGTESRPVAEDRSIQDCVYGCSRSERY